MIRIIEVNNLNDPGLEPFAHLNENQLKHYYEPYGGLFIGESPNVVLRALDAGYEPVAVLMEKKYIHTEGAEIFRKLSELPDAEIPVYVSTIDVLSQITGYHLTRGILCAFRRKMLPTVDEVCNGCRRIAVLENIENPTNVGAIFRSAAALNMDGILLTPECADPLYRRAIRVSVGTVFQIPWTYIGRPELHYTWLRNTWNSQNAGAVQPEPADQKYGNTDGLKTEGRPKYSEEDLLSEKAELTRMVQSGREAYSEGQPAWPEQGMRQLHELGFRTAAMALRDDTVSIEDPRLREEEKLAVILGNEGDGLLSETIRQCDYTIRIPMSHGVDSLNVAAASAVAFWELGKRQSRE